MPLTRCSTTQTNSVEPETQQVPAAPPRHTTTFAAMTALWSPNQVLQIQGKARPDEIQCSGLINKGAGPGRCGWEKRVSDADNRAVQAMLPRLARKRLPDVTLNDLLALAELCLCRDWHADQKYSVARRWEQTVRQAAAAQRVTLPRPAPAPHTPVKRPGYARPVGVFGMATPPSSQSNSQSSFTATPSNVKNDDDEDESDDQAPPSPQPAAVLLRQQLADSQSKFAESQSSLADSQTKLTNVQAKLAATQAQLTALDHENKQLQTSLTQLKEESAGKEVVAAWARAHVEQDLARTVEQLSALSSAAEKHEEEQRQRLAEQEETHCRELQGLQTETEQRQIQIQELQDELVAAQQRQRDQDEAHASHTQLLLEEKEGELQIAGTKAATAAAEEAERIRKELGAKINALTAAYSALEASLEAKDDELQKLRTKLRARDGDVQELRIEKQAREREIQDLRAELRRAEAARTAEHAAAQSQRERYVQEAERVEEEVMRLKQQLDDAQTALAAKDARVAHLEGEIRAAQDAGVGLLRRFGRWVARRFTPGIPRIRKV